MRIKLVGGSIIGIQLSMLSFSIQGQNYNDCYHNCDVIHNYPYEFLNWTKDTQQLLECRKGCSEKFTTEPTREKNEKKA